MNPDYNLLQQKIYSDYSLKSDDKLLEIVQNKKNYIQSVTEIVIDILEERGKLPESFKKNKIVEEENYQIEFENQKIINHAAHLLFVMHKSPEEAIQILSENGLESNIAEKIINNLLLQVSDVKAGAVNTRMLVGAIFFIGGIIVTVVTYSNAIPGGTYIVAWGAILFGAIQFFRGLSD